MKNLYVGFDCAIKSLAIVILIHDDIKNDINIVYIGLFKLVNNKLSKINNKI